MPTLWGAKLWGTFKWGGSDELIAALSAKTGTHPVYRITWKLDDGDQDLTPYFDKAAAVSQTKERAPDKVTAGDCNLSFRNHTDVFTETSSSSFLYGVTYHNRNIVVEIGFEFDDGTIEYVKVATMKVRSVTFSSKSSKVSIRVYDLVSRLIDETVNRRPSTMVAELDAGNTGDGTISDIDTKPFETVSEDWTLTCTTLGGADTAEFSVVGSVSGNIGTATSDVEFSSTGTGGVQFEIEAGAVDWAVDDAITFSTVKMMEWTATNPAKILWALLTGHNYDSGAAEDWHDRTPQLDDTQSNLNTDINHGAWVAAISACENVATLKGFFPWDTKAVKAIEEILLHFLGSMNIDGDGRIYLKVWVPEWAAGTTNFADSKKVMDLSYTRDIANLVNRVNIRYRKLDKWEWSDVKEDDEVLSGLEVQTNATSKTALGQWKDLDLQSRWYNSANTHANYVATRLLDKYGIIPKRFTIKTGLDALETQLGDIITLTDTKSGNENFPVEIVQKRGNYTAKPINIVMEAEDTGTVGIHWGFLGSSADENDGLSPQAASHDDATDTDKTFCYLSQTGGSGSVEGPDYYLFAIMLALIPFIGGTPCL